MDRSASMSPGRALMSEGMEAKDRLVEEILLLALFIVSTAANSLALLVFCRRPGLRTISNRFVINLLATNLLTTCLLAPALFGEHSAHGGPGAAAWTLKGNDTYLKRLAPVFHMLSSIERAITISTHRAAEAKTDSTPVYKS
ncbi:PREDICTED: uncharacterized protein LOC106105938 [Papilio polytes]|uniref:uncharacterized protein LOC106105938 n=1 Tax=Papilio polytes TaxID=76194 RepID=UPI0006762983|nr:PREDICTED: uncharacterized protein LOC106105938 [Papilio polytes]